MAFSDLLKAIHEETDRTQLAAMADKYPSLKRYAELGEQVEGLRPRLKALSGPDASSDYESNVGLVVQELEEWRKWQAEKYAPIWEESQSRRAALEAAEAKIMELETRGLDMTPEEFKQMFEKSAAELGFVRKGEVDSTLKEFTEKQFQPALNRTFDGLSNRFEEVYRTLTPRVIQHEKDFGEVIDIGGVFQYMKDNKVTDPDKAYESFVAPKRQEKLKVQTEADKKAEYERGISEGRKLAAQSATGRASIVNGTGSDAPGALMTRYREKQEKLVAAGKVPDGRLGSGASSREMAQEYAQKLAAGTGM